MIVTGHARWPSRILRIQENFMFEWISKNQVIGSVDIKIISLRAASHFFLTSRVKRISFLDIRNFLIRKSLLHGYKVR